MGNVGSIVAQQWGNLKSQGIKKSPAGSLKLQGISVQR